MKKTIFKFLIIFVLTSPILLFLHIGFFTESTIKVAQTFIFAAVLSTVAVWPNFRRFVLVASLCLILIMAILYIVDMIEWADILGSTGIGLVVLVLLTYLPQLIKKGYIEKL